MIILIQFITNILLFFSGVFGILLNRKNFLLMIMCIELMLLSINLNFITFSLYLDDFYGQIFSLLVLTIAAAESAIGLALLILYNRIRFDIDVCNISTLKG